MLMNYCGDKVLIFITVLVFKVNVSFVKHLGKFNLQKYYRIIDHLENSVACSSIVYNFEHEIKRGEHVPLVFKLTS